MDLKELAPLKHSILELRCPVIGVIGLKGGPGKTTFATNLTWGLNLLGLNVLLVDCDHSDQLTASLWAAATPDDNKVSCVQFNDAESLKRELPKFRGIYDAIVVDGRPNENIMTAAILKLSNLVIIPSKPSPVDVWRISDTIELTKVRMELDDSLKVGVVLNETRHNSKSDERTRKAIAEEFDNFPVLKSQMSYVDPYQLDLGLGRGVLSRTDKDNVAIEFKNLMIELGEVLNG